ncbi:hypothetical protein [Streptomyces sedi]|uniref:Uncharacterized protein n=1 Tax=Streptomyces sedi TaxID=555059 RepID=A0A5C4VF02_9ACTN|nr:hypothetical protein [Streptomyces sedi]TNM34494.1 hypothetical protein FH715_02150 [Streptomyces sedi]
MIARTTLRRTVIASAVAVAGAGFLFSQTATADDAEERGALEPIEAAAYEAVEAEAFTATDADGNVLDEIEVDNDVEEATEENEAMGAHMEELVEESQDGEPIDPESLFQDGDENEDEALN